MDIKHILPNVDAMGDQGMQWWENMLDSEFHATASWLEARDKEEKCKLCTGKGHSFKYCGTRKLMDRLCMSKGYRKVWGKIKYLHTDEWKTLDGLNP